MMTIALAPLQLAEVQMLADAMGFESAPVVTECIKRAEGNPLFFGTVVTRGAKRDWWHGARLDSKHRAGASGSFSTTRPARYPGRERFGPALLD